MSEINTWPGWECKEVLGEGAYGKVYRIEKTENGRTRTAALKVLSIPHDKWEVENGYENGYFNTENEATTFYSEHISGASREFEVLKELRGNRNIVGYEDHMIIPHEGWPGAEILIRMELLTPLSRYNRDHTMTEREILKMAVDISYALEACHSKNPPILHRDIKPANIMVDRLGNYKLGDFGIARVIEGTKSAHTIAGTEEFMAPEVQKGESYGESADIYSLGMVLYKLLNGNRGPFLPKDGIITSEMRMSAKEKLLSGHQIPIPENGSPELKRAVLKAMSYRPADRWKSASDFCQELEECVLTCEKAEKQNEKPKEPEMVLADAGGAETIPPKSDETAWSGPKSAEIKKTDDAGTVMSESVHRTEEPGEDETVYSGYGKAAEPVAAADEAETVYAGAKKAEEPAPDDDKTVYSGAKKTEEPKKKKKWIPAVIAAVAAVCIAAGAAVFASQKSDPAESVPVNVESTEETAPAEVQTEEEDAIGYAGESFTITLNCADGEASIAGILAQHFSDAIESETDGAITVDICYDETLVSSDEEIEACGNGTVNMIVLNHTKHKTELPILNAVPAYAPDSAQNAIDYFNYIMSDSDSSAAIQAEADAYGIKYLSCNAAGTNYFIAAFKFSDFSDLISKSASFGSKNSARYEPFGITITKCSSKDYYEKFQTCEIDAVWGNGASMYDLLLQEVTSCWMQDNTFDAGDFFTVNLKWWNSLSADTQTAIQSACDDTADFSVEYNQEQYNTLNEDLADSGHTLAQMTDDEFTQWWSAIINSCASSAVTSAQETGSTADVEAVLQAACDFTGYKINFADFEDTGTDEDDEKTEDKDSTEKDSEKSNSKKNSGTSGTGSVSNTGGNTDQTNTDIDEDYEDDNWSDEDEWDESEWDESEWEDEDEWDEFEWEDEDEYPDMWDDYEDDID